VLGNALIGLREGLEAGLVVSILVAFLVRTDRRSELPKVWLGVGIAIAVSVGVTLALALAQQQLTFEAQETFGGGLSIIAVGFVTWMIFWMRRAGRSISAELRGKLEGALAMGPTAVVVMAALAVGREGLETALFLWSNISHSSGSAVQPVTGAVLGLATAVVLGYLIYRGGLKLNLSRFFTWTGAALIVVAAGVFGYAFHDLQEANVLPGLQTVALQPGEFFAQFGTVGSWLQTAFHGIFNVTATITWLQLVAWVAYLVPVMYLFLRPTTRPVAAEPTSTAVSGS
jgi:high-affinity iron transporter